MLNTDTARERNSFPQIREQAGISFHTSVAAQAEVALFSAEVNVQTDKCLEQTGELHQRRYTVTCNQANLGNSTYNNYMQDCLQTPYPNGKSKNNLGYDLD